MNREIKFRAFGLEDNTMSYWSLNDAQSSWVITDQKISEVMQFTGLKDKNGKEIYEGDVFIFEGSEEDVDYVDNLQHFFEIKGIEESEYGKDYETIEVLGNIYEDLALREKICLTRKLCN